MQLGQWRVGVRRRQLQRRHGNHVLTGHGQRLPAGCQHLYAGRGSQYIGYELGDRFKQMLAVIHHEQELLAPQVGQQECEWFGGRLVPQVKRRHGSVAHERLIRDFCKLDEPGAAAETPAKVGGEQHRQARLADPAGSDEAYQSGVAELPPDLRELAAASDEASDLDWDVAGAPDGPSHHRTVYGSAAESVRSALTESVRSAPTESVRLGTGSAISPMWTTQAPS